jgi:MFS family permease
MHGAVHAEASPGGTAPPGLPRRAANYTLAVLCAIAVVNYIDRMVLSILLEEVKHDLGASDTQMGLLNGFVFTSVYIIAGVPIARWVDSGSRRNVLVICMVGWSVATILCGLTRNYWQLALARVPTPPANRSSRTCFRAHPGAGRWVSGMQAIRWALASACSLADSSATT